MVYVNIILTNELGGSMGRKQSKPGGPIYIAGQIIDRFATWLRDSETRISCCEQAASSAPSERKHRPLRAIDTWASNDVGHPLRQPFRTTHQPHLVGSENRFAGSLGPGRIRHVTP